MRNDKASIHHEKKEELWLKSNEKLRDWSLITRRGGLISGKVGCPKLWRHTSPFSVAKTPNAHAENIQNNFCPPPLPPSFL